MLHGQETLLLQTGNETALQTFSLNAGTYRADITYTSDNPNNAVTFVTRSNDTGFLADTLQLYPFRSAGSLELWALHGYSDLQFVANHSNEMTVTDIRLYHTNAARRMLWTVLAGIFLIGDLIWLCLGKKAMPVSRLLILLAAALLISVPLFWHNLIQTDDITFHLERIEGIKEALLNGQFPARILPNYFDGAGYAVSVFYGDILLYFPALLRIMGFPLQTSLECYMAGINFGTVFLAYYAFSKAAEDRWAGTIAAVIYTVSVYRFTDLYRRGALGEYTALMFLPLVVGGFYLILRKKSAELDRKVWRMPAIGMAGIITCHNITSLVVFGFLLLWCVLYLPSVVRDHKLMPILKTALATAALSAFYLIPFLDYMLTEKVNINAGLAHDKLMIQQMGVSVTDVFSPLWYSSNIRSVGLLYLLIIGAFLVLNLIFWPKLERADRRMNSCLFFMTIFYLVISTKYFQWDILIKHSSLIAAIARVIQFPYRFIMMILVLCALEAGLFVKEAKKNKNEKTVVVFCTVVCIVLFVMINCIMIIFSHNSTSFELYDRAGLGLYISYGVIEGYIMGDGEYLPVGTDNTQFRQQNPVLPQDGSLQVTVLEKKSLYLKVSCRSQAEKEEQFALPLLFYKGYQAWNPQTRQHLTVQAGTNNAVTVTLPGQYQGDVVVAFQEPWLWRAAEAVSLLSILFLVLQPCAAQKRKLVPDHNMQ